MTTIAGISMPANEARDRLASITRSVAMALHDSVVRKHVFNELHHSQFREHKLHFGPFVSQQGSPLKARIAALRGLPENAVGNMLDSLIDLEFYMPVKDHWAKWTGGPDLIVATALKDHEIPVAYDLDGKRVVLSSATIPPATPTLAIVPVETDFTTPPASMQCYEDCTGGGGGGGSSPPPGLNMTFSYIGGDWEGFLMGDPEFEVHVFTVARNSPGAREYRCAGEHASVLASVYDQNATTWTGNVELLSSAELVTFAHESTHTIVQVWEDDRDACVVRKNPNWVTAALSALVGFIAVSVDYQIATDGFFATCQASGNQQGEPICWASMLIFPYAFYLLVEALQNDDYVGTMVPTSRAGVSYPDANYVLMNENGVIKGRVMLTGLTYIAPAPPSPQLHTQMSGPTTVVPNTTNTWSVSVTGASGSISYQWFRDGVLVSSSSLYSGSASSGFTLSVYVTSGSQAAASARLVSIAQ